MKKDKFREEIKKKNPFYEDRKGELENKVELL